MVQPEVRPQTERCPLDLLRKTAALSALPDLSVDKSGRACLPPSGAIPRQPRQARPDNPASGQWRAPCLRACALRQSDRGNAPPERFRSVRDLPVPDEKRHMRWTDVLFIFWPRRSSGMLFPLPCGSQTLTWFRQTPPVAGKEPVTTLCPTLERPAHAGQHAAGILVAAAKPVAVGKAPPARIKIERE